MRSGTRAGLSLVILVWKALTVRQRPSRSPLWLQQPGSSLQVCCLQGLFRMVAVLSAASPQHAQADDWMGLYGLLCFRTLTVQVDPRSRSTNSVQRVQLRVVPGLRRYSTFTRGSIRLLMTLTDLIVISDVTVASTMWNFYRFRVGGTCPLAGQPRIFWSWGWVTVK